MCRGVEADAGEAEVEAEVEADAEVESSDPYRTYTYLSL